MTERRANRATDVPITNQRLSSIRSRRPIAGAASAMWMDGHRLLGDLLAQSNYGTILQAVAGLTLFTSPATVARVGLGNVFRVVRRRNQADVGKYLMHADGNFVLHDDNSSPTDLFLWANGLAKSGCRDVQFNHVYDRATTRLSGDGQLEVYTALPNICVTPAFLAKLTDTDLEVRAALRYRVYDLYEYAPDGVPTRPGGYMRLTWRDPLLPVDDPEGILRQRLHKCSKRRITDSARELGWRYSQYRPDPSL